MTNSSSARFDAEDADVMPRAADGLCGMDPTITVKVEGPRDD